MARTPSLLPFSGTKLRELRERRGWLQSDVARFCAEAGQPVNRATLSRYEKGESKPTKLLPVLAEVFEVDVDVFLNLSEVQG